MSKNLVRFGCDVCKRTLVRYTTWETRTSSVCPDDTMKNPHVNSVCRAKIYAFLLPPETFECLEKKITETNTIPTRGVTEKTFNSSLTNKLIGME